MNYMLVLYLKKYGIFTPDAVPYIFFVHQFLILIIRKIVLQK